MTKSDTAYDYLEVAGQEAANAIRDIHHLSYAQRYNRMWDALHVVTDAYIEYKNKMDIRKTK